MLIPLPLQISHEMCMPERFRGGDERSTSSRAFRVAGAKGFAEAGIIRNDVDHLMIYEAPCSLPGASFAHPPIYGLEDLGPVPRGETGAFIAERSTAPGARDGPQAHGSSPWAKGPRVDNLDPGFCASHDPWSVKVDSILDDFGLRGQPKLLVTQRDFSRHRFILAFPGPPCSPIAQRYFAQNLPLLPSEIPGVNVIV
jgi:hypothetical protein